MIMNNSSKWPRRLNALLSVVLGMLGFSACSSHSDDGPDIPVMYGTPYVKFKVMGKVTGANDTPLSNARVITRTIRVDDTAPDAQDGFSTTHGCDTVYTNTDGGYSLTALTMYMPPYILVVQHEGYDETSEEVSFNYSDDKFEKTVNITLKPKGTVNN